MQEYKNGVITLYWLVLIITTPGASGSNEFDRG